MTTRRLQRLVLTGSITGAVIVALDGTVLTVAQPALQRDLQASFGQVQWTGTGYLIAVASLLVFATASVTGTATNRCSPSGSWASASPRRGSAWRPASAG